MEEIVLVRAIAEGEDTKIVSQEAIFDIFIQKR
jgi:hypothetical protein